MTFDQETPTGPDEDAPRRRWGEQRALFDDAVASSLLIEAAMRCIVRRGTARVSMGEVAGEAGVARSTLYRYFPSRNDLIAGILLARAEAVISAAIAAMPDPADAAMSLPGLIVDPVEAALGTPLANSLFSPGSQGVAAVAEFESEALLDQTCRQIGPILESWQASGQIRPDLDIRMTVRWLMAQTLLMVATPWRAMQPDERRRFAEQYVVSALLAG